MINAAIVALGVGPKPRQPHPGQESEKSASSAACTRSVDKARAYGAEKGFPVSSDYAAILADRNIDAVVLATPHSAHAEQVMQAARAGKHVFCEKPFTLSRASAEQAIQACADRKVTLMVGYNWRYQPALQEVFAHDWRWRLGRVLHVEGNFNGRACIAMPRTTGVPRARSARRG